MTGRELEIVPVDLGEANEFVRLWHRHHSPVVGHKFSLGVVAREDWNLHGVAIVGRPTSRVLDDGWTLDVYRLVTDEEKNACSCLLGACRRATFALGYKKLITYTLVEESGSSLRAAGWKCLGEAGGGSWSCLSRPRVDKHPLQRKLRWEVSYEGSG